MSEGSNGVGGSGVMGLVFLCGGGVVACSPVLFSDSCRPRAPVWFLEFLPGSCIKLSGVDSGVKARVAWCVLWGVTWHMCGVEFVRV